MSEDELVTELEGLRDALQNKKLVQEFIHRIKDNENEKDPHVQIPLNVEETRHTDVNLDTLKRDINELEETIKVIDHSISVLKDEGELSPPQYEALRGVVNNLSETEDINISFENN